MRDFGGDLGKKLLTPHPPLLRDPVIIIMYVPSVSATLMAWFLMSPLSRTDKGRSLRL